MRRSYHHRLRAALLAGLVLLTAAAMAQPATATATSTIPTPERWLPVAVGTHSFGHLRAPDAIVAKAGPDQVGFWSPKARSSGVRQGRSVYGMQEVSASIQGRLGWCRWLAHW